MFYHFSFFLKGSQKSELAWYKTYSSEFTSVYVYDKQLRENSYGGFICVMIYS